MRTIIRIKSGARISKIKGEFISYEGVFRNYEFYILKDVTPIWLLFFSDQILMIGNGNPFLNNSETKILYQYENGEIAKWMKTTFDKCEIT